MKKIIVAFMFGLLSLTAFAEATFEQVQGLIEQHQYQAAEQGLEVIIKNHPQSAKAFYAMAQAQAGLGNQEKAKKALDISTGLNPTLDFAPASAVASLKEAITPQVKKIESIEESHFGRDLMLMVLILAAFGVGGYFWYKAYQRKEQERTEREQADQEAELAEMARHRAEREERVAQREKMFADIRAEQAAKLKAEEALKSHKNYGHERFDPQNPDKLLPKKTKAQLKAEADADVAMKLREAQYKLEVAEAKRNEAEALARGQAAWSRQQPTTVVNNSGNDMLTGVLIGNMLSGSHHDHNTTIIEREVVREVPSTNRSSTWDDTPSSSSSSGRSSTWDDSSSKSSSWDSGSSSSSSSWSSGSDSSSSWSSSDSSSSSSSDW